MDKVTQLKAVVFDILRRQSILQQEIQKLDQVKEQRLTELTAAEKEAQSENQTGEKTEVKNAS